MKPVRLIAVLVAVVALGACSASRPGGPSASPSSSASGAPSTASPSGSPFESVVPSSTSPSQVPTPSQSGKVTSAAQAAALVFASNPLFALMAPALDNVAGQSRYYTASQNGDSFTVSVTIGSGDCESGCITSHTWNYSVSSAGDVSLASESGDEIEVPTVTPTDGPATVNIRLSAGPVCPVERDPPDPSCAPRPIAGTEVVLRDPHGLVVARASSDAQGQVSFTLASGAYYAESATVPGLMGQAQPVAFAVVGGSGITVSMGYDTGIR